ncbi:uncharacterized protein V1518DRAFT_85616 [Limtongia smithiae]|uniref:uncharacterized protein n=1 Tax=Limtongia smithiae TaxID=1125753 RepID=UPI0034CD141C
MPQFFQFFRSGAESEPTLLESHKTSPALHTEIHSRKRATQVRCESKSAGAFAKLTSNVEDLLRLPLALVEPETPATTVFRSSRPARLPPVLQAAHAEHAIIFPKHESTVKSPKIGVFHCGGSVRVPPEAAHKEYMIMLKPGSDISAPISIVPVENSIDTPTPAPLRKKHRSFQETLRASRDRVAQLKVKMEVVAKPKRARRAREPKATTPESEKLGNLTVTVTEHDDDAVVVDAAVATLIEAPPDADLAGDEIYRLHSVSDIQLNFALAMAEAMEKFTGAKDATAAAGCTSVVTPDTN